jgi:hypothetical protein
MWLRSYRFPKERAPTEATPTPLPATSAENGMVLGVGEGLGLGFGFEFRFGLGLDCVGSSLPPLFFTSPFPVLSARRACFNTRAAAHSTL